MINEIKVGSLVLILNLPSWEFTKVLILAMGDGGYDWEADPFDGNGTVFLYSSECLLLPTNE